MSAQAQKFEMFDKSPLWVSKVRGYIRRSPFLHYLDGPLLANFLTSAAASLYSQADLHYEKKLTKNIGH